MAQRVGGRRATRRDHVTRSPQVELHRQLAAERAGGRRRDGVQADGLGIAEVVLAELALHELHAGAAASDHHAEIAAFFQRQPVIRDARVLQRFGGGRKSHGDGARDVAELPRGQVGLGPKPVDFPGDLCRVLGGVERFDAPDAALSLSRGFPESNPSDAVGRDGAQTRHDDATAAHGALPMGAACHESPRAAAMQV